MGTGWPLPLKGGTDAVRTEDCIRAAHKRCHRERLAGERMCA